MCPEDKFGNTSTSMCKPWSVIIAHLSRVTSVCKPWSIVCYASVDTCKQVMWLMLLPGIDCPDRTTMNV